MEASRHRRGDRPCRSPVPDRSPDRLLGLRLAARRRRRPRRSGRRSATRRGRARPRHVAAVHAALNVASLALYAASWAARPRRQGLGAALALGGLSVSGVSAYKGGHLAIGEKVGTTTETLPRPSTPS